MCWIKRQPGLHRINHQTCLCKIPGFCLLNRTNDLSNYASVCVVSQTNAVTNQHLSAIWVRNHRCSRTESVVTSRQGVLRCSAWLAIESNLQWMFCAIGIEPVDLATAREFLQVIVSQRSLDQIPPFGVTDRNAEEIIPGIFCLPDVKNR